MGGAPPQSPKQAKHLSRKGVHVGSRHDSQKAPREVDSLCGHPEDERGQRGHLGMRERWQQGARLRVIEAAPTHGRVFVRASARQQPLGACVGTLGPRMTEEPKKPLPLARSPTERAGGSRSDTHPIM
ncbi:hypothetical protein MRX96_019060 [Rhipicephalus microplus]